MLQYSIIGFLGNLGTGEIILIVLAILILFGAKKIPELAKGVGKGMKEFKKAVKDVEEDIQIEEETSTKEPEPEKNKKK